MRSVLVRRAFIAPDLVKAAIEGRLPLGISKASLRDAPASGRASLGTNLTDAYRLTGIYAGRILKGENPAELPVMEPTRFDFLINLRAARSLNLAVPPELVAIADEVID